MLGKILSLFASVILLVGCSLTRPTYERFAYVMTSEIT